MPYFAYAPEQLEGTPLKKYAKALGSEEPIPIFIAQASSEAVRGDLATQQFMSHICCPLLSLNDYYDKKWINRSHMP
jgi:hypothetical protein